MAKCQHNILNATKGPYCWFSIIIRTIDLDLNIARLIPKERPRRRQLGREAGGIHCGRREGAP